MALAAKVEDESYFVNYHDAIRAAVEALIATPDDGDIPGRSGR
jgi:hypothetical protein